MIATAELLRERAKGKTHQAIADTLGVTHQAVSKRLQKVYNAIDELKVKTYDDRLPELLKTSTVQLITESLNSTKLKKCSTLQGFTAAGICIDKIRGYTGTNINISILSADQIQINQRQEQLAKLIQDRYGKPPAELIGTQPVVGPADKLIPPQGISDANLL